MRKIIACIDGSTYADSICALSAWASEQTGLPVSLLHVLAPHSETSSSTTDMSGQIGLGAKSDLLEELSSLDETHGKREQEKSRLMLEAAKEKLGTQIPASETLQRRGSLAEALTDLEKDAGLIILGKHGERHQKTQDHLLGSNIERVAREVRKPLLIAPLKIKKPFAKFLIAYDGSPAAEKAVDYAARNPLLENLECHLLQVGETSSELQTLLDCAEKKLNKAGVSAHISLKPGKFVETIATKYLADHEIDLLIMGAYGHSKIRSLILGSVTSTLISRSDIPVMLFHP